jgi:hypothetical protein
VLQLVYTSLAGKVHRPTTFEVRNTSWNEGRNALLARARTTYPAQLPQYLIFMDCDARLVEVRDFGSNTGDPYRTLEKYLKRYEPAVGHAHFDWQPYDENLEIQVETGNYDAICNAFHRHVIDFLLPYNTLWDEHSWHYSQQQVHTLTSALFPHGRAQFNALRVLQRAGHAAYPRGAMWEVPFLWLVSLFRNRTHARNLPVHHLNLEHQPRVVTAALIRNVNSVLNVVYRHPRPSSAPTPLCCRGRGELVGGGGVEEENVGGGRAGGVVWDVRGLSVGDFDLCHPYWADRRTMNVSVWVKWREGGLGAGECRGGVEGGLGGLDLRGKGGWVRWGAGVGVGGMQGGGGGQAGVSPPEGWLRDIPLQFAEKEALRVAFVGGAATQDWSCPPMKVSWAIMAPYALGAELGVGGVALLECVAVSPQNASCWHDLALISVQEKHLREAVAMFRTAFRLLGGAPDTDTTERAGRAKGKGGTGGDAFLKSTVSQNMALVLDELGATYGALYHATLAASGGDAAARDWGGAGGARGGWADRWLNVASICKKMCLYRCAMGALDAYLQRSCSADRCRGKHLRTAVIESWVLMQAHHVSKGPLYSDF